MAAAGGARRHGRRPPHDVRGRGAAPDPRSTGPQKTHWRESGWAGGRPGKSVGREQRGTGTRGRERARPEGPAGVGGGKGRPSGREYSPRSRRHAGCTPGCDRHRVGLVGGGGQAGVCGGFRRGGGGGPYHGVRRRAARASHTTASSRAGQPPGRRRRGGRWCGGLGRPWRVRGGDEPAAKRGALHLRGAAAAAARNEGGRWVGESVLAV